MMAGDFTWTTTFESPNSKKYKIEVQKLRRIRLIKVCDEKDCELFHSEISENEQLKHQSHIPGDVLNEPYIRISDSVGIDARCAMCIYCKKVDMKKELFAAKAAEMLSGEDEQAI